MNNDPAADVVQREALSFEPTAYGMGPLLEAIGNARLVLICEATHGTHEFSLTRNVPVVCSCTVSNEDLGAWHCRAMRSLGDDAWWPRISPASREPSVRPHGAAPS